MRGLSHKPSARPSLAGLRAALGPGRVLDGPDAAPFARDQSHVPAQQPLAAIEAQSVDDVITTLRWASEHKVPVTPRGAGTGKAGGAIPSEGGLVLSLARMDGIDRFEDDHGFVECGPGLITARLRDEAAGRGLLYAPDPASLHTCTLGGNVATNAGGPLCVAYGVTRNHVLGVRAVLADGRVLETGRSQPKGVAGYDLMGVIIGSEGTLAVIVGLRLALLALPTEVVSALWAFPSARQAARALTASRRHGVRLRAAELIDGCSLRRAGPYAAFPFDPRWGSLLLVEADGDPGGPGAVLQRFGEAAAPLGGEAVPAMEGADGAALWAWRRAMSQHVKKGSLGFLSEDVAVPLGFVPDLIDAVERIAEKHHIDAATYGHLGDGNLHVNLLWADVGGPERAIAASDAVFAAALALGGTITGEHGVGLAKKHWLPREVGTTGLDLMRGIKAAWDPNGVLNPGKLWS